MRREKLWKLMLFLALSLLFLSCATAENPEVLSGNTSSNLANGGLLLHHENKLYFNHFGDNNSLYQMSVEGSEPELVREEVAYYLNSGEAWLYFISGTEDNAVVKMHFDGSGRRVVSTDSALTLQYQDGFLYYISRGGEGKTEDLYYLFRMTEDGKNRTPLLAQKVTQFYASGDALYFIGQEDQCLYKADKDGSSPQKLYEGPVVNFVFYEKALYLIDAKEEKNQLWRIGTDGRNPKLITDEKLSAFNISDDTIYYGNTTTGAAMLELKKMNLDGTSREVLKELPVISIFSHESWLCLLSMDFSTFSIRETLLNTAEGNEMVFEYVNPPAESAVSIYPKDAEVIVDTLKVKVKDSYATNLLENEDPALDSLIFDSVTDGTYLFLTVEVENVGEQSLNLYETLGHIEDITEAYPTIYWYTFCEADDALLSGEKKYMPLEKYTQSFMIQAHEKKTVQLYVEFYQPANPVHLSIHDPNNPNSITAIEITPEDSLRVESFESSMKLMEETFRGKEIQQINGIGFKRQEDPSEVFYYTFEVRDTPASPPQYYFVERRSGEIYTGEPDASYPDFTAVPIELWRKP